LDLRGILKLAEELPFFSELLDDLMSASANASIEVIEAAKPFIIAAIHSKLKKPLLVVTSQPDKARQLYEQLLNWCLPDDVVLLPEPELLPYQRAATDALVEQERLNTLSILCGKRAVKEAPLVVTAAPGLISKVAGYDTFASVWQKVSRGEDTDLYKLIRSWQDIGYRLEDIVELPGEISHRGGILDIYPVTSENPYRLEFFGNTIENIRSFNPENQLSSGDVSSISIGPAVEILKPFLSGRQELQEKFGKLDTSSLNDEARRRYEDDIIEVLEGGRTDCISFYAPLFNDDCILSYLPEDALVIIDEPEAIRRQADFLSDEADEMREDKLRRRELPVGFPNPYFTWEETLKRLEKERLLSFVSLGTGDSRRVRLKFAPTPVYAARLPVLFEKIKGLLKEKHRFIVTSHQADRLSELLNEEGM